MVGSTIILGIVITLFITLIVPVAIPIVYNMKNKGKGVWLAWFLGAAGFVVTQLIIRVPILNILATFPWFNTFATEHYVWYCAMLALTAALFEVVARFGVAKILQKNINCQQGMAVGLGHGGIEAVILIGMTYVNNLIFAIMINTGSFDMLVDQTKDAGAPPETLAQLHDIKVALVESTSYVFYLAGYERILTMIFHAAMSMLVCYMVYKKKAILGVVIAFLAHFLVDFISPLINGLATPYMNNAISQGTAYAIIYIILTAVALVSVMMINRIYQEWENEEQA